MLARCPGEFIQAFMIACGVASSPVPQARFSPIRHWPGADRYPAARMRSAGCEPLRPTWAKYRCATMSLPWPTAARCRRSFGRKVARPRSARTPLSRQSVASATVPRLEVPGASVALAHASPAPTPSRRLGARRTVGSIGPPGESSRREPPLVSVIASPRWPSVTPTLRLRAGPGAAVGAPGALAEPQPATPRLVTARRAGIRAVRERRISPSSSSRAQNLRDPRRASSPRRRRARRATRGRRGR